MKHSTIFFVAFALVAALTPEGPLFAKHITGPGFAYDTLERPDPLTAAQMSLADAKEIIQKWGRWTYGEASLEDAFKRTLEFTPAQIVTSTGVSPVVKDAVCPYETFDPAVSARRENMIRQNVYVAYAGRAPARDAGCGTFSVAAPSHDVAMQTATAMLRWKNSTLAERQALLAGDQEAFAPIVAAYRASNPSPQIPEDVHRSFVMAQAAIQDKRFSDAVDDFEDGLKLAPWWPEGHFNIAIILGELHYYDEAIDHMKKYIALVPDASNARAAQDKIYVWEGEQSAAQ